MRDLPALDPASRFRVFSVLTKHSIYRRTSVFPFRLRERDRDRSTCLGLPHGSAYRNWAAALLGLQVAGHACCRDTGPRDRTTNCSHRHASFRNGMPYAVGSVARGPCFDLSRDNVHKELWPRKRHVSQSPPRTPPLPSLPARGGEGPA